MRNAIKHTAILLSALLLSSFVPQKEEASYTLTVKVQDLRNSAGVVQFALYNEDGTIPDEHFEHYFKIVKGTIVDGSSSITFKNIPSGKYAVSILHDEDKNGKLRKPFIIPKEGIGFSNFSSIGLTNQPNFSKSSFDLKEDKTIRIKMIYM